MTTRGLLWIARAAGVLVALSAVASAQFSAAPGSPITVGSGPFSVAVGDFNGDGKPDLAIANFNDGSVTVLLGSGTGAFTAAPGSPFPVGKQPASVAVGDFNGDGKLDLAIANFNDGTVTVLLGDGTGGFTAATGSPFPVGTKPTSAAVGDFNRAGKLDLAIANSSDYTVTVLLGDGTGGFTAAPGSPFPVGTVPESVAVGDFNGDGKPDLAVANFNDNTVTVLLGDGTGGFAAASGSPFPVGSGPWFVAVGDFNGDGKPDLAIANFNDGTVTVLLGNGTGGFTPASNSPFAVGNGPTSVAVGDFNEDGQPDLAITNYVDGTVTVLLGDGTGGFAAGPGSPFTVGQAPTSAAVGDFNGDGRLDLAITNSGDGTVTVLLGNGTQGFTATTGSPFTVGTGPSSVAVGDFNRDGKPDLAIANAGSNNVTVLLNSGTGSFTPAPGSPFPAGSNPDSVAVGDFNGDGNPDLAIANFASDNVTVLLGNGTGGFTAAPGSPFAAGSEPTSVAVGDFNGDGRPDLAVANYGSGTVTVLLGNGRGGFTAAPGSPFAVGSGPMSVAVGDFNGDGKPDLAIASLGAGGVTVLLGDGTGRFTAVTGSPFAVGSGPICVAVGDFNGDGKPDLAVGTYGGALTVLLGDGTGGFTAAPGGTLALGGILNSVAVADFNGDGKPDVAIADYASFLANARDTVVVLLGDGSGGFTAGNLFLVGADPTSVAAGDFNGDGKLDLAVANGHDGTLTVLLNGSAPQTPALLWPGNGANGVSLTPALNWSPSSGATSYDVYFGTSSSPPLLNTTAGTSFAPGTLAAATVYFWRVVAKDSIGSSSSVAWSFTTQGAAPPAPTLTAPASGATGVALTPTLSWNASAGAASYEVYFGTASTPPLVTTTAGIAYVPPTLSASTTYYWQIVAQNSSGSASSPIWSFTTAAPAVGLLFVPVTPCRVADTRNSAGPFGGPTMTAGSTRSFAIPQSACSIPSTALEYSLNVTVVPAGPLGYLSLWPTGQTQPYVSTLNSPGGIVLANAALVPAGSGGAVSVYVSDETDVILDIDGYFATSTGTTSYSFYPAPPCRIADTRNATGQFGWPSMTAGQTRDFPIPLGPCSFPPAAQAYSLNVTVAPPGPLGYLTTWPTGQAQPNVSTLNSGTGKIVANAALVPGGTNESISVYVTDPTDVILDGNGYFAAPGSTGALTFYPVTPCRVADTRNAAGPFGGPELAGGSTRSFTIPASACSVPSTAAAYSLNVTVVPDGVLYYLTAWPAGSSQPLVSTLNSFDGSVVANAAIVPAGTNGAVSIYVTNPTQVILDINGYFAP